MGGAHVNYTSLKNPPPRIRTLWALNFIAFAVHAGMGTAVIVYGSKRENVDIRLNVLRGIYEDGNVNVYQVHRPAMRQTSLVLLCASFAFVSAFAHFAIVVATFRSAVSQKVLYEANWYYNGLFESKVVFWRYLEYALSAPIMIVAMMLLAGISSVDSLSLSFAAQSAVMLCGWLTEEYAALYPYAADGETADHSRTWRLRMVPYALGWFIYVPTWVVFLASFYGNVAASKAHNGTEGPPSFVYAIIVGEVVIFTLFALPLPLYQRKGYYDKYWQTEIIYAVLSLLAKTFLNGMLLWYVFGDRDD